MPTFRSDIESIQAYIPGKPIEDVMREYGLVDIIKLASNECPVEPFPAVQEAVARAASESHRYPDTAALDLTADLAETFGLEPANIWVGPGSSSLLIAIAHAMGGPGTSAVFSDFSFVLYGIISAMSRSTAVTVPVDAELRLDTATMADAVRPDTTVMYVCNPNNPSSTYVEPTAIDDLIAAVPEEVLIVVDEAYEEYVTHPRHRSAVAHSIERDNVVVLRTFSKIYGIAGLRVGYAIGRPDTIGALRRLQAPFAITNVSLAGAAEALRHQDLVAARAKSNAAGRNELAAGFSALSINHFNSETNFVLIEAPGDAAAVCQELLKRGVIVRQFGPYIRVTVGTEAENARLLENLGELV